MSIQVKDIDKGFIILVVVCVIVDGITVYYMYYVINHIKNFNWLYVLLCIRGNDDLFIFQSPYKGNLVPTLGIQRINFFVNYNFDILVFIIGVIVDAFIG